VRLAFVLGWLDGEGRWTEDPDTVAARLTAAAACKAAGRSDTERLRDTLAQLAQPVRARLAVARERRWATTSCDGPARVVASRLQIAVREAARRRDASRLETLERALGFVAGGHTAGETMLLERLAVADDATFGQALARLPPPSPRWGTIEARLSSVLLFGEE
jgi:hypothetical protein